MQDVHINKNTARQKARLLWDMKKEETFFLTKKTRKLPWWRGNRCENWESNRAKIQNEMHEI